LTWKIEVSFKPELSDPIGSSVGAELRGRGFSSVEDVRVAEVYLLSGPLDASDLSTIGSSLLADPVVQEFRTTGPDGTVQEGASSGPPMGDGEHVLEVYRHPGVMDPHEMNIRRALRNMSLEPTTIRTGRQFRIKGRLEPEQLLELGNKVLSNPVIEELEIGPRPPIDEKPPSAPDHPRIEIALSAASDVDLARISKEHRLALSTTEMQSVRDHFLSLGREPSDIELLMIAQTWSEHCKHKTLAGPIDFMGVRYKNLLGETIMSATRAIAAPWCLSVFKDNAGVIALTEDQAVCFKVETHNHPSAIEPYGGAGTGIGGVIRDVLGTGLGARPVLNTDVFCFAPPDTPDEDLPPGTLHPLQVFRGVVAGVRDYGNRMGIPTASGAIHFDVRYAGNPLVYCGTVGILPRDKVDKAARAGDLVVSAGGRTGRDGLGGATFSSLELSEESESLSSGAVQIGNAIEEKRLLDAVLQARDRDLFTCITDCGAGGLSSAVGEMGEHLGFDVELDRVPLKYPGLSPTEIWLSEAQERMVMAVPGDKVEELAALFASEDVEMTVLGTFTGTGRAHLTYRGETVLDLDLKFLHDGLPRVEKKATWTPPAIPDEPPTCVHSPGEALHRILACPTVASKEWVIRQYDHQVQGMSVIKSLVGEHLDGPGDACVFAPAPPSRVGIAVGCGLYPDYGDLDPYRMATCAIDEAIRNVVAVGADPARIALLDNFSWGSAERPEALGALVLAARACGDLSRALGTPFISGKDSLNNEYRFGDRTISIPHTLLISSLGIVPEVTRSVTMDLKGVGHNLYLAGMTRAEMGGSTLRKVLGGRGGTVPEVDPEVALGTFRTVHRAIQAGLVRACHDLSEGGLAAAVAESAFAGWIGARIQIERIPRGGGAELSEDEILFSESCSRFLLEVRPDRSGAFERIFADLPLAKIGETIQEPYFVVHDTSGREILREGLAELKESWQAPLRFELPRSFGDGTTSLPRNPR